MKHRPYKSATERNREVARREAEAENWGDTILSFTEIRDLPIPKPGRLLHVIDEINHFDILEHMDFLHERLNRGLSVGDMSTVYANGMGSKGALGMRSYQHQIMNGHAKNMHMPLFRGAITGRTSVREPQPAVVPMQVQPRWSDIISAVDGISRSLRRQNNINVGTIGHVDNFTLCNATPNPVTHVIRHLYADNTPAMVSNPTILDALKSSPWQWYEPRYGSYTMKYPQLQQIRK